MNKLNDVIWGGMVGDAASMGFHWLYDPDRIKAAGGETPEFHDPDPSVYADVQGAFVHHGKKAGDITLSYVPLIMLVDTPLRIGCNTFI